MDTITLPPAQLVIWKTGTPLVEEGGNRRYWCAVKSGDKIAHRVLEYLNRYVMPVSDQCEPSDDAEPVPDSDGDYYWTGWFESSCDQCDIQWRYSGDVVAWMALPKLKT